MYVIVSWKQLCVFVLLSLTFADVTNGHNAWVVILSTSRYWFNYRHAANGVLVYKLAKSLGVADDHIVFFNALDISNDDRNPDPGYVHYNNENGIEESWDFAEMEVDFTQDEVSSSIFTEVMTGRSIRLPSGRSLLKSDGNSSILLYMAGHGGDEFFKFHDHEELSAQDLAHMFHEMHLKKRYKDILMIVDTCQASTMANYITAPGIITLASSVKGENSYAYPTSDALGVAIVDRFTHSLYSFFQKHMKYTIGTGYATLRAKLSLHDLYASFQQHILHSTATIVASPGSRNPRNILLSDYFARVKSQSSSIEQTAHVHSGQLAFEQRRSFVEKLLAAE